MRNLRKKRAQNKLNYIRNKERRKAAFRVKYRGDPEKLKAAARAAALASYRFNPERKKASSRLYYAGNARSKSKIKWCCTSSGVPELQPVIDKRPSPDEGLPDAAEEAKKMESTTDYADLGPVPGWLEIQGLSEESLQAAVMGLGIEILGALCARAEPVPARVRFRSLATWKFTSTMYAKLCCFMESCHGGRGSELAVTSGHGKDAEQTGGPAGLPWTKVEGKKAVGPEDEGKNPEYGAEMELLIKFPCTTCSHSFATKAGLKIHMKRHRPGASDKKYKCPDCPFKTQNKTNFTTHTRIHTGERPFTCLVCEKAFNQSAACQAHMRIHTGERPYVCTVCGKAFVELSQCQVHMRIHTGERPHICNVCAKSFSDRSTLKRHLTTHTGEMPYICSVCSKAFSQSSSCKKHMRIHTGERPYTCTVCAKSFSVSSTLRQHMRIHTGEKPYSCSVCGKAFVQAASYHRHIKIHMR